MQTVTLNLDRIQFDSQLTAKDIHIEASERSRPKVLSEDITDKLRFWILPTKRPKKWNKKCKPVFILLICSIAFWYMCHPVYKSSYFPSGVSNETRSQNAFWHLYYCMIEISQVIKWENTKCWAPQCQSTNAGFQVAGNSQIDLVKVLLFFKVSQASELYINLQIVLQHIMCLDWCGFCDCLNWKRFVVFHI